MYIYDCKPVLMIKIMYCRLLLVYVQFILPWSYRDGYCIERAGVSKGQENNSSCRGFRDIETRLYFQTHKLIL